MPPCTLCGTEVRWANYGAERIKLENLPSIKGADRFREISYEPLIVQSVAPEFEGTAYARHDCRVSPR